MDAYIVFKLIHIAAIVIWSAGLLYLPGLLARHAGAAGHEQAFRRLRHQTRLVYVGLMSPAAVIAVLSGTVLVFLAAALGGWLVLKLIAVSSMVLIHTYLGRLMGLLYENPGLRRPGAHLILLLPIGAMILTVIGLVSWKPV